ncbi:Alpha/beta hydrolase domain-containing protein 17B [Schistosoma haematobium]|uniref:Alpha/beta hydrolase domain-containing protein 17B n=2 Tax=Schistosoma haematobium TaxID=6185 RepID=A0A6A5DV84_SCHHA|nr:Alpha/beta hydrolase domain-containing protein 17B [Schistosoma haematobium]KAH9596749.1 Alpha/beta hydrolase domain-containing protein 17B [Schistosoma haematobium]CAH8490219.1 unnamed protein product [Schistosoma haematobium]CAH8491990.1 unnamed protein product [Schistosoma haematobium]
MVSMSSLFGEICQLFCCPPRPSHIVAKLAFLPPPPTYSIISSANDSTCCIEFKPEAGWQISEDIKSKLTVFYTLTKRQSRIVCMHIPANSVVSPSQFSSNISSRRGLSGQSRMRSPALSVSCPTLTDEGRFGSVQPNSPHQPTYTVLFSHGNAVDIGQMAGFLQSLAYRFSVNILCYDYSGYGGSSGQRLEENLYADADAVLNELRERFNVPLNRIVLYGQSIGTAPTVELATKYKVAGVVLHSPFMSGLRVVCPGTTRRFCFDPFTNIDKVSRILSPTLIIHGTDDEIIGIDHGRELYSRLTNPLEPAWIEGAGHNDIELFSEYASRLDRFFNEDIIDTEYSGSPSNIISSVEESLHVEETPDLSHQTSDHTKSFTALKKNGISSSQSSNCGNISEVPDGAAMDTATSSMSTDSTSSATTVQKLESITGDVAVGIYSDNEKINTNGAVCNNTVPHSTNSSDTLNSNPNGMPSDSSTTQLLS